MKLTDTTITPAGVYRCCLGTVATEHEQREVEVGTQSRCCICGTEFTLVTGTPEGRPDLHVWTPNWQIEKNGDPDGVLPPTQ